MRWPAPWWRDDQTAVTFKKRISHQVELDYLLHLPQGYDRSAKDQSWPLILFLHGAGERGSDLEMVKKHGPPKLIAAGKDIPAIVVSPQCPTEPVVERPRRGSARR